MAEKRKDWVDDVELEDVTVKWVFSHFDGRKDVFNEAGHHDFQVILPEELATKLEDLGWSISHKDPYEEGDPPEHLLKIKISYKYGAPKIFLIKNERKFRADERDLADIRRDVTDRIDVIITPSRWAVGGNTGITAYVKEMYVHIRQSRFSTMYEDLEEV